MWDLDDPGAETTVFRGPGAASIAFNPVSGELAVGHWNGTISVWKLNHPEHANLISIHRGYVYSVAYAPDGKTLATAGSDGTVQLWRSTEALAAEACSRVRRNMSSQEWERFVGASVPYEPTCPNLSSGTDAVPTASLPTGGSE